MRRAASACTATPDSGAQPGVKGVGGRGGAGRGCDRGPGREHERHRRVRLQQQVDGAGVHGLAAGASGIGCVGLRHPVRGQGAQQLRYRRDTAPRESATQPGVKGVGARARGARAGRGRREGPEPRTVRGPASGARQPAPTPPVSRALRWARNAAPWPASGWQVRRLGLRANGRCLRRRSPPAVTAFAADSTAGHGVHATARGADSACYGLYEGTSALAGRCAGRLLASNGVGVRGGPTRAPRRWASTASPRAGKPGYFQGNVQVTGTLTKAGGSFKIDHPLDPANRYLSHSFVESPDMKNVYDGVVDARRARAGPRSSCRSGSRRSTATSATSSRRSAAPRRSCTSRRRSPATASRSPAASRA